MSTKIVLLFPFKTAEGKTLKSVTMRRPKVKDMRQASNGSPSPAEQEMVLFALLTGLVPEDFDEMDMADYGQLQETFRQFLDKPGKPVADESPAGEVVPVPAE